MGLEIVSRQFSVWNQSHSASGAESNVDEVDLETPRALDKVLVE
jgi:hypothetical protein